MTPSDPDGSSPLARGLQRRRRRGDGCSGIIPARAGFTVIHGGSVYDVKDHPRSRGVYLRGVNLDPRRRGSSPLARGLPTRQAEKALERLDHPRSRGVYIAELRTNINLMGSSPLARGLLTEDYGVSTDPRIIPARAGFTAVFYWDSEYDRGSSPLARGLLKWHYCK